MYAASGSGTRTSYHLGAQLEDGNNSALGRDKDQAATSGWNNDFSGLSIQNATGQCGSTAGTAGPGGTERCYDVIP
jgi:hypothetical protein